MAKTISTFTMLLLYYRFSSMTNGRLKEQETYNSPLH